MNIYKSIFLVLLLCTIACKPQTSNTKMASKVKKEHTKKTAILGSTITKKDVLGKINYRKDRRFKKVSLLYTTKTIYLQKETLKAFLLMASEANKAGVQLKIISGTRNFYEQKAIWERKWEKYRALKPIDRAKKILTFSSMPSTSRHHWGTDIDINNLNNSYFEKGKGQQEYLWLIKNANQFGFYQVYTSKGNGRTGYNEEKWHWSYIPLANQYLSYYKENIQYVDIQNFKGALLSKNLRVIEDYVFGISKEIPNQ